MSGYRPDASTGGSLNSTTAKRNPDRAQLRYLTNADSEAVSKADTQRAALTEPDL